MKASEVITGAIDLISQYGLRKGDYGNKTVGFCTVGALDYSAGWQNPDAGEYALGAFYQAKDYVANAAGVLPTKVAVWSDAPDRTREDVITTLVQAREQALRVEN